MPKEIKVIINKYRPETIVLYLDNQTGKVKQIEVAVSRIDNQNEIYDQQSFDVTDHMTITEKANLKSVLDSIISKFKQIEGVQ